MTEAYEIRPLRRNEWEEAMKLAWDTFMIYEAPEYSMEGVQNFHDFIWDPVLKKMFVEGQYQVWAAYDRGIIIGVLGVRNRSHVSLLFVDQDHHHEGIATALLSEMFSYAKGELNIWDMTVNAAPYAIEFYHKVGFRDLGSEQLTDGIRYTPMIINLRNK